MSAAALAGGMVAARPRPRPPGDARDIPSHGFDLSHALVPVERIVAAGMPRDGLIALDDPELLTVDEVARRNASGRGKFLLGGDRVIGVAVSGDARAYPLQLLCWHEVVNDTVGGIPVAVTYNPLCDSVVVVERAVDGQAVRFGLSGLLYNSNLLLYDRAREGAVPSLWSQLLAAAVAGPAAARHAKLRLLPAELTSWRDWVAEHPDTRVLAPIRRLDRLYGRDPYSSYFGSDLLRFPVEPLPPAGDDLALKDRVVVVTAGDSDRVFPLRRLATSAGSTSGTWRAEAAGVPISIRFDARLGTASVQPLAEVATPPAVRYAFWFAWYAAHPQLERRDLTE